MWVATSFEIATKVGSICLAFQCLSILVYRMWLHMLWFALRHLGLESFTSYNFLRQERFEYNNQSKKMSFVLSVVGHLSKMSTVYHPFPNPREKKLMCCVHYIVYFFVTTSVYLAQWSLILSKSTLYFKIPQHCCGVREAFGDEFNPDVTDVNA